MVTVQEDPFEPPKFKTKRIPRGPPSPPVPVLHSPPRKVTAEEQEAWRIPPCISNWKNPKGYTIPLDKRMASDGRGLQQVTINDNFAKLSESLYLADRHAREEIEKRAALERKLAENEKKAKEEHLRQLAQKAREERANLTSRIKTRSPSPLPRGRSRSRSRSRSPEKMAREREEIRYERRKERERETRLSRMGEEKRKKMIGRNEERDISEKIALGGAQSTYAKGGMYDQRLFNQSEGISSGFGDDEAYNLYDKPLFNGSSANMIYKPRKAVDSLLDDEVQDEVSSLLDTTRFKAYKGFKGADEQPEREGPVQFEKEADPFGVDEFLDEARKKA
jgi:SNW domain-containing protein 1